MSDDYGFAVSKEGYDVKTCNSKYLGITSKYDTMRVYLTGTLSVTVPAGEYPEYEVYYFSDRIYFPEDLGYVPFVTPPTMGVFGTLPPCGPTGWEECFFIDSVVVTSSYIELQHNIVGGAMFGCNISPADTRTFDFTVFRNPIDSEFDLQ